MPKSFWIYWDLCCYPYACQPQDSLDIRFALSDDSFVVIVAIRLFFIIHLLFRLLCAILSIPLQPFIAARSHSFCDVAEEIVEFDLRLRTVQTIFFHMNKTEHR